MKECSWLISVRKTAKIWALIWGSNQREKCRNPWQTLVFEKKTRGVCRQASKRRAYKRNQHDSLGALFILRWQFYTPQNYSFGKKCISKVPPHQTVWIRNFANTICFSFTVLHIRRNRKNVFILSFFCQLVLDWRYWFLIISDENAVLKDVEDTTTRNNDDASGVDIIS